MLDYLWILSEFICAIFLLICDSNVFYVLCKIPSHESCVLSIVPGKLLGRTQKIAFNLLHKVGPKGDPSIKPGDRVCLFIVRNIYL